MARRIYCMVLSQMAVPHHYGKPRIKVAYSALSGIDSR